MPLGGRAGPYCPGKVRSQLSWSWPHRGLSRTLLMGWLEVAILQRRSEPLFLPRDGEGGKPTCFPEYSSPY